MRAKLSIGAVFALIAVLVPVYAARATAPGKNGRIAFRGYLNANQTKGEIFTINPNGAAGNRTPTSTSCTLTEAVSKT